MTVNEPTNTVPSDGITDLQHLAATLTQSIATGDIDGLLDPHSDYTLSETIQHATQSIQYAMTGYPKLSPAIVRKTVGRIAKHAFLGRGAMKHNLSAPVPGAPELDHTESDRRACEQLTAAIQTLAAYTGAMRAHPVYGVCTKEQSARLQAMHLREHIPGLSARMTHAV